MQVQDVVLTRDQYRRLRDGERINADVEQGGQVSIATRLSEGADITLPPGAMDELLNGSTGFGHPQMGVFSIRLP